MAQQTMIQLLCDSVRRISRAELANKRSLYLWIELKLNDRASIGNNLLWEEFERPVIVAHSNNLDDFCVS